MTAQPRIWILSCAVACFAAGVGTGLVLPGVVAAWGGDADGLDHDESYVQRMTSALGLSPDQVQKLRCVMLGYKQEREAAYAALRSTSLDRLPPSLKRDLIEASRRQSARIREILRPDQLARYDDPGAGPGEVR